MYGCLHYRAELCVRTALRGRYYVYPLQRLSAIVIIILLLLQCTKDVATDKQQAQSSERVVENCVVCGENTVERLSGLAPGLRQSYHSVTHSHSHRESPNDPSQHTLHKLRVRRLSKTHSTVIFTQQSLT